MAEKTPTELQAVIDAYIKTNGLKSITGSQMNTVLTNVVDSLMFINTAQTITGVKTFLDLPISIEVPTADDEFTNKKYVDDSIAAIDIPDNTDYVALVGNQSIDQLKTFTTIPNIPTTTPTVDAQVASKKYVDDQITASKTYKVYTALLTQSGDGTSTQTSGTLTVGKRYAITTYVAGDDFSNVANVVSGTVNTTGCEFIATGTTPTTYTNGSTLTDTAAPVATVLENTLGFTPTYSYSSIGSYRITSSLGFTTSKTIVIIGSANDTDPDGGEVVSQAFWIDSSTISIMTRDLAAGNVINEYLNSTPIEIRVYD